MCIICLVVLNILLHQCWPNAHLIHLVIIHLLSNGVICSGSSGHDSSWRGFWCWNKDKIPSSSAGTLFSLQCIITCWIGASDYLFCISTYLHNQHCYYSSSPCCTNHSTCMLSFIVWTDCRTHIGAQSSGPLLYISVGEVSGLILQEFEALHAHQYSSRLCELEEIAIEKWRSRVLKRLS